MKSLKVLFIAVLAMVATTVSAQGPQGQQGQRPQRQRMTVEQRAQMQADRMTKSLDLNDEQKAKIYEYHLANYKKALDYMGEYQKLGGETGRSENYVLGFSNYKHGNFRTAATQLAKVCGPDDELS